MVIEDSLIFPCLTGFVMVVVYFDVWKTIRIEDGTKIPAKFIPMLEKKYRFEQNCMTTFFGIFAHLFIHISVFALFVADFLWNILFGIFGEYWVCPRTLD